MAYNTPTPVQSIISDQEMDCKVATSYEIFKTISGKRFMPIHVAFLLTTVSGFVSEPQVSVGTDSPVFSNVVPITTLTGLTTLNSVFPIFLAPIFFSVAPTTDVKLLVNSTASATTYKIRTVITGFYY